MDDSERKICGNGKSFKSYYVKSVITIIKNFGLYTL